MEKKKASSDKRDRDFIEIVWNHYRTKGRHGLPWRKTANPYRILVSEIMLQQTQVVRVLPKYKEFLKLFPTVKRLAHAPLGDVLKIWQGLGYNRRAKFLWQTAQVICDRGGKWPKTYEDLRGLPGIGSYTAAAVMSFAYNQPSPLIETNIRTVYIHHFFQGADIVSDKELLQIIERTLDTQRPREWNWALMDYGAYLKETVGNVSRKSKAYQKQSQFKESNRYVRGAIMRALTKREHSLSTLLNCLHTIAPDRTKQQLMALCSEGLVVQEKRYFRLP